jgi:hypothetical protein
VFSRTVLQLLFTANVVPSSMILYTLIMKAIRSSETSVRSKAARRHISEDGILLKVHNVPLQLHQKANGQATSSSPIRFQGKQNLSLGTIRLKETHLYNCLTLNLTSKYMRKTHFYLLLSEATELTIRK